MKPHPVTQEKLFKAFFLSLSLRNFFQRLFQVGIVVPPARPVPFQKIVEQDFSDPAGIAGPSVPRFPKADIFPTFVPVPICFCRNLPAGIAKVEPVLVPVLLQNDRFRPPVKQLIEKLCILPVAEAFVETEGADRFAADQLSANRRKEP